MTLIRSDETAWLVDVEMSELTPDRTHVSHIRLGSCNVGGPVIAALADVQADQSGRAQVSTRIEMPRSVLLTQQHYIVVHADTQSTSPVAACGDSTLPQNNERFFSQTGFGIDIDAFWEVYRTRGGHRAFGFPMSREITLEGCITQFFQWVVMQYCGADVGVTILNLLDPDLLPYTGVNGSRLPGPDEALKAATPKVGESQYGTRILRFVRANAPDVWEGEPVNFGRTFFQHVTREMAGTNEPGILGLMALEVLGPPISRPARDPNNHNFVYQRFQRGILHYDATSGMTHIMPVVDWFRSIITGQRLPPDLREGAGQSPFIRQYCPESLGWVCRRTALPSTDLTLAFQRE